MVSLKKAFEIYCETESAWIRSVSTDAPTLCPNDAGHIVTAGSVHDTEDVAKEYDPSLYIDFEGDNQLKRHNGLSTVRFLPQFSNVIHVTGDGTGDYTTIAAAIAARSAPMTIYVVAPGIYVENNPLVVPNQCSLVSLSGPETTTVMAANAGSALVSLNLMSRIEGFHLNGANRGVIFDGTGTPGQLAAVKECIIRNCDIGIEVANGSPNALNCFRTQINSTAIQMTGCIRVHSGGRLIGSSLMTSGLPNMFAGYGCLVEDAGSQVTLDTFVSQYCTSGLCVNNGGEYRASQLLLENNTNAIHVGSTGNSSKMHCVGAVARNNVESDLLVEATGADVTVTSSQMDRKKIKNVNSINLNTDFSSTDDSKHFRTMTGDIRVGTVSNSAKMVTGHGKHYSEGMVVLLNDSLEVGSWTDVTQEATSGSGSTWALVTGLDGCLYIGSDYVFCGFKVMVTEAALAAAIEWEYWNGQWTSMSIMATQCDEPYYSRGKHFLTRAERQHVRFGFASNVGLQKKMLNAVEKYWIRGRNLDVLQGSPQLEQIQLHTVGTTELNSFGILEHSGDGRTWMQLPWTVNTAQPFESSPGNQDLYLSSTLGVGRTENQFTNAQTNKISMVMFVPEDMDTSFPIKLKIAFMVTSQVAGDIKLVIRRAVAVEGDSVYTSGTGTSLTETATTHLVAVGANEADRLKYVEYDVDTSDLLPRPESLQHPLIWISLERQGGDSSDTYSGTMNLLQLTAWYMRWSVGGHITLH